MSKSTYKTRCSFFELGDCDYTDEYKEAVAEGKEFVIMKGSFDSFVNRNNVVTTRVLLPRELGSRHKDMLAQLPVENIATWY